MSEKAIMWLGSTKRDLCTMPEPVMRTFGYALGLAQNGLAYEDAKTLRQFSPAVVEILEDDAGDTYRAMYTAKFSDTIYVLHCFKKKSTSGRNLPKRDRETIEARLKEAAALEQTKREENRT